MRGRATILRAGCADEAERSERWEGWVGGSREAVRCSHTNKVCSAPVLGSASPARRLVGRRSKVEPNIQRACSLHTREANTGHREPPTNTLTIMRALWLDVMNCES